MWLWLLIAFLTAFAVLSVLAPLARRRYSAGHRELSKRFYETQVADIDHDLERGMITAEESKAARSEAARRLIASSDAEDPVPPTSAERETGNRRKAALLALLLIPMISLFSYYRLGNPSLADRPLHARLNAPAGQMDIYAAVAKIERHLAQRPDDARGWEVVAPVYLRIGRPADAARAWANVIRIDGPSAIRHTAYGEALFFAGDGRVSPQSLEAFRKAVDLDPGFAQARFYIGLAAEQAGDKARAREIWTKLLADAPADANYAAVIRERIAALGPATGDKAAPQAANPSTNPSTNPAPNAEAAKAIAALPEAERMQAIRGMVDNLAARLKDNGKDANGWARLIRAYVVLKDTSKAREALVEARRQLAGDAPGLELLDATARDLGLGG